MTKPNMCAARLSWNMSEDGVAEVFATGANGSVIPVLDVWRRPMVIHGDMTREEAKAFQVFLAERICALWNTDQDAAQIAEKD